MSENGKWTEATFRFMFEMVMKKFGPYKEWETTTLPGRGLDAEYKQFVETFGAMIGSSPNAVGMNISRLGSGNLTSTDQHSYNAVMRKAAAYASGFVDAKNFKQDDA